MMTTTVGQISFHTPTDLLPKICGQRDGLLHCTFGRMNPPTTAHIDLIAQMECEAHMGENTHLAVYLSKTVNEKNPLTVDCRMPLIAEQWPRHHFEAAANLFEAMDLADQRAQAIGVRGIVWWTGTDRLADAKRLLLYPDRWDTPVLRIAELHRTDDRSATAMRAAALNSDYETFERLAGVTPNNIAMLFECVQTALTDGSLESTTKATKQL